MKNFFRSLVYPLANRLFLIYLNSERARLLKAFKSCGKGVLLRMPVRIDNPENVELGDNVDIGAFVHMWGAGGIRIGNTIMIGSHVEITSLGHDLFKDNMYGTVTKKPVVIEDDADIGSHSVILPGVTIGKGAVVGAGSVVTSDVKPYTVLVTGRERHECRRPLFGKRREDREKPPV